MKLKHVAYLLTFTASLCIADLSIAQAKDGPAYAESVPEPTLSEVKYGPDKLNVLDYWQAQAPEGQSGPRPVAFVIHGGAWIGGSKEVIDRFVDVQSLLDQGISVVAINYRLISKDQLKSTIDEVDMNQPPKVQTPLYDAMRALQFVRSKSQEWGLDKTRIAAAGGSAGACTSLWLLYHDDMAEPDSDDPVARESTRLICAGVRNPQTTLDPQQMKEWTPNSTYGGHAFGLNNFQSFLAARDQIMPWIKAYSPYHLVTKDDPPVYLYFDKPAQKGENQKDPTHSANFGSILLERCNELGVSCEFYYPGATDAQHSTITDFLITKLLAK